LCALGAATALVGALTMVPGSGAAAEGSEFNYAVVGTASAQGFRMTYGIPNVVIVNEFFDGGGPVAQSLLDNAGQSVAFASLPYPGENAIAFPGVFALVTGQSLPGGYPFYAQAVHPQAPTAEVKDPSGSYTLSAAADEKKATGDARLAFGGEQSVSKARSVTDAVLDDGKLTVSAESVADGLSVGNGALRIASVVSRSVSTYMPGDSEPKTKTELQIEGAKVGETPVTIGRDGVAAGGGGAPVPIGEGSDQLNQALSQSGLSVRTVSSTDVKGGGAGDLLEIRIKHPVPSPEGGQVEGTLIMRFGGSTTAIAVGGEAAPVLLPEEESVGPESSGSSSYVDGSGGASAAAPLYGPESLPSSPNDFGGTDDVAAMPTGAGGATAGAGLQSSGDGGADGISPTDTSLSGGTATEQPTTTLHRRRPSRSEAALAASHRERSSVRWLFGFIGLGGLAVVASSALWRRRGMGVA
jgi:hypothetical protein